MSELVLVLNSGSSSLKYQLLEPDSGAVRASGLAERIGEPSGRVTHESAGVHLVQDGRLADHGAALKAVFGLFTESGNDLHTAGVAAVGHRVVHGGERFYRPTLITDEVVKEIAALSKLAPLHNPANVLGIVGARELLPGVAQVAVFDTAFFHGLPRVAQTYAISMEVAAQQGIRRYGFHGTSHEYVSGQAAKFLGREPDGLNQIVFHLGNGASASAIRAGQPVDTTMGFTPLEGLVMGTRGGDLDPGVTLHLARNGYSADAIDELLNRNSGLKGLSGVNDFRELQRLIDAGDDAAQLAYAVYIHRLRRYLGAYLLELGHTDTIIFTAGVGENAAQVRSDALAGLEGFGIEVSADRNSAKERGIRTISPANAAITVLVVPTNEELAIARATVGVSG